MKRVLLPFVLLIQMSCAVKSPATIDYDVSYDFSRLKTYAWVELAENHVATLDNKRENNAIEAVLAKKGFIKSKDVKSADVLLKTHMVTDNKLQVDRFFETWGYYPFYNHRFSGLNYGASTVREYKIGTLVLDIVDPAKKQVIWRSSVSKPLGIYKKRSPEKRALMAMDSANHLLFSFPPEKKISKSDKKTAK